MFHNNYIRGWRYKNLRFKEMGYYVLDVDGEYSSTTAKYLTTYTLDIKKENHLGTSPLLQQYLDEIITICNSLERIFVIPPLYCNKGESGYCNICYYDRIRCFKPTLDKLKNGFRESVITLYI